MLWISLLPLSPGLFLYMGTRVFADNLIESIVYVHVLFSHKYHTVHTSSVFHSVCSRDVSILKCGDLPRSFRNHYAV